MKYYGANRSNCIGHGMQASVHKIYYPPVGDYCALKLFKPSALNVVQCLINETRILKTLNSYSNKPSSLPEIYRVNAEIKDSILLYGYIIMELFEGQSLEKQYRLYTTKQLVKYWLDIAKAMSYAHGLNIYHCDLNPGNILISSSNARLIDWGWGIEQEQAGTRPDMPRGRFQPPEQAHKIFSRQTDVYGAGATLLWLLTGGYHPTASVFQGRYRRSHERIRQYIKSDIWDKETISIILEKATAGNTRHRYQNMDIFYSKVWKWFYNEFC